MTTVPISPRHSRASRRVLLTDDPSVLATSQSDILVSLYSALIDVIFLMSCSIWFLSVVISGAYDLASSPFPPLVTVPCTSPWRPEKIWKFRTPSRYRSSNTGFHDPSPVVVTDAYRFPIRTQRATPLRFFFVCAWSICAGLSGDDAGYTWFISTASKPSPFIQASNLLATLGSRRPLTFWQNLHGWSEKGPLQVAWGLPVKHFPSNFRHASHSSAA